MHKNWKISCSFALLYLIGAAFAAAAAPPPSTRDAPFIETFHRNHKTLIYVAAAHHSPLKYPDAFADPTFQIIDSVFLKTPPEAVIVEGVDPSQISGFLDHADQCAAAKFNVPGTHCGEPDLAAYAAQQRGISVYTGEPTARFELSFFQSHGYSIQDFLAFWIMANISFEKSQGQMNEAKFRRVASDVVANLNHSLGASVRFTPDDFAAWYAKHIQTPRNYLDLTNEDAAPYPPPEEPKTVLHTLSALCTEARDKNVAATIKTLLRSHNRVLVVYGASHLDFEWQGLTQLMGVPKKTKPF